MPYASEDRSKQMGQIIVWLRSWCNGHCFSSLDHWDLFSEPLPSAPIPSIGVSSIEVGMYSTVVEDICEASILVLCSILVPRYRKDANKQKRVPRIFGGRCQD